VDSCFSLGRRTCSLFYQRLLSSPPFPRDASGFRGTFPPFFFSLGSGMASLAVPLLTTCAFSKIDIFFHAGERGPTSLPFWGSRETLLFLLFVKKKYLFSPLLRVGKQRLHLVPFFLPAEDAVSAGPLFLFLFGNIKYSVHSTIRV